MILPVGPIIRRALLAGAFFFALLAAGCAAGPPTNRPDGAKRDRAAGPTLRGKDMGKVFVRSALENYRFHTDDDIVGVVQGVGRRIVSAAGADPATYHFFVVENPQANAFAIPGGYVFVFDGLLRRLGSEEELAGVLAHEVAHVRGDHFFKDQKKTTAVELVAVAAILLGQGSDQVAGVALAGASSMQLSYSRENEREADQLGVGYLAEAGYRTNGMTDFFDVLMRQQNIVQPRNNNSYLSTHPGLGERNERLRSMIRNREAALPAGSLPQVPPAERWERLQGALSAQVAGGGVPGDGAFMRGMAALRSSRYAQALPLLDQAVAERPGSAPVLAALAECLVQMGDARADEVLERARQADPHYAPTLYWEGEWRQRAGDVEAARAAFRRALLANPDMAMANFRLSQLSTEGDQAPWGRYYLARYLRLTLHPQQAGQVLGALEAGEDSVLKTLVREELRSLAAEGI